MGIDGTGEERKGGGPGAGSESLFQL